MQDMELKNGMHAKWSGHVVGFMASFPQNGSRIKRSRGSNDSHEQRLHRVNSPKGHRWQCLPISSNSSSWSKKISASKSNRKKHLFFIVFFLGHFLRFLQCELQPKHYTPRVFSSLFPPLSLQSTCMQLHSYILRLFSSGCKTKCI